MERFNLVKLNDGEVNSE